MKKLIALSLAAVLVLGLTACGKITLHCDSCGTEVSADSNMDESWLVYCKECEPEVNVD